MNKNGFTLIEVMVALMILALITLSFSDCAKIIMHSRHVSEKDLAMVLNTKSVIEKLSVTKFDDLATMSNVLINGRRINIRYVSNDLIEVSVGDRFVIRTLRSRYN